MAAGFCTLKAYQIPEKRELIIKMAKFYTSPFNRKATYVAVAEKFGVNARTVSKYFKDDLPHIDKKLAEKVQKKKDKAISANQFKAKTK